jgi:hypothetical protein
MLIPCVVYNPNDNFTPPLWQGLTLFAIAELILLIWALIDILHRKRVNRRNNVLWIIVVVLFMIIGPVIYLLLGRREELSEDEKKTKF